VVFTNSVPGLKKAVLSLDEKTSTVVNELGARTSGLSRILSRDRGAQVQPVELIRQPEVKPFHKKDPGLELMR
jgi:hypothetical protein